MDKIFINELMVRGIIGINEDERDSPQDIIISLGLYLDLKPAGENDDISLSINYRTIVKRVMAYIESARRFTVEALAEDLARLCFEYPEISRVLIRVEKPSAARYSKSIGVEIDRQRL